MVSGVKQTRKAPRGVKRQECEKHCRRNVGGPRKVTGKWTREVDVALGDEISRKELTFCGTRSGIGLATYSVVEAKLLRG